MKKKLISIIIAIAIVMGGVAIYYFLLAQKEIPKTKKNKITTISVTTQAVDYKDVELTLPYTGRIEAKSTVTLSSEVSGRIISGGAVLNEGVKFKKGDLLLSIFSEDIEASYNASISSFLKSIASILPDIKVDYPDQYDKWSTFFHSIKVGKSLPKLPKITDDKERIFLTTAGILSSYYSIEQGRIQLSKYKVYAPFSGSFTSVSKEVGSVTSMGGEVAKILQTDIKEVSIGMLPYDALTMKKGDDAFIIINSDTILTSVDRVSDFINTETQRIDLYTQISGNDAAKAYSGQVLEVTFPNRTIKNVMKIPREALLARDQVYSVVDNKIYPAEVNVVRKDDDFAYINGLKIGDVIVSESVVSAYKGMTIKIKK